MDLALTDEQQMLRSTVRDVLTKHSTPDHVRELEDDPKGYRDELWKEIVALGLLELGRAETLELALVCEEMGRALASTPYLVSGVLAASALAGHELEPRIRSGEAIVTCAWLEAAGAEPVRFDARALHGEQILVPFASSATHLLVLAADGLYLADLSKAVLEQTHTIAADARYTVRFDATPAERAADRSAWDDATTDALIALAAFCVGGAERAHELAVEYAKERVQFDRPIGSFQGIAHPLADIATDIGGGRVLAYQAAWRRASGRDAATTAAMAKLFCADVFRRATKVGQQVFGGIGFTRAIDMQLYFRWAKEIEISWWSPRELEARIAAAELDGAEPFITFDAGA